MSSITIANRIRRTARLTGIQVNIDGCRFQTPSVEVRARRATRSQAGDVVVRGHWLSADEQVRLVRTALTPWELDAVSVSIQTYAHAGPGEDYGSTATARIFGTIEGFMSALRQVPDLRSLGNPTGYSFGDALATAHAIEWEAVSEDLPDDVREVLEALSAEWHGTGIELLEVARQLVKP